MYCTYQDIEQKMGYAELAKYTDKQARVVDSSVVEEVINSISAMIDGYLRGRYNLPLINTHFIVQQICIDFVCYELRQRNGDKPSEGDAVSYSQTLNKLKDIQKGYIVLDETATKKEPVALVISSPPIFNEALKRYRNLIK